MKFIMFITTTIITRVTASATQVDQMVTPPIGSWSIWRPPSQASRPAAMTWPMSLVLQSRSKKSSSTPITTMSVAAQRIAMIVFWLPWKNTALKYGICEAISSAASSPVYMAMPPRRGVGRVCTSRARISG